MAKEAQVQVIYCTNFVKGNGTEQTDRVMKQRNKQISKKKQYEELLGKVNLQPPNLGAAWAEEPGSWANKTTLQVCL